MSSEDEESMTSPEEYFGTPEGRLAQEQKINIQFTLRISKVEIDQFEHFYKETDGCACADSLGAMYHYVDGETSWNREKIKRFLTWFVLKGLEENWLLAELGF